MSQPIQSEAPLPRRRLKLSWLAIALFSCAAVVPPGIAIWLSISTTLRFEIFFFSVLIAPVAHALWYTATTWRLVGAHVLFDLVRLARRGRSTSVRVFYVSALLLVLALLIHGRFGRRGDFVAMFFESGPVLSMNDMGRLSEGFVAIIIILQNLAVLLLTPAYLATAITEERERRTLELLFTSPMSNRQIVNSKFTARIAHMAGVLLAGLPILSLAQLLGGVDMWVLLANFANTAMNLCTVGSVCILVSVYARSGLSALLIAYSIVGGAALVPLLFAIAGISSPLIVWQQNFGDGNYGVLIMLLLVFFLGHLWTCVTCLKFAAMELCNVREDRVPPPDRDERLPAGRQRTVGDNPLLWKEWHVSGRPSLISHMSWLIVLLLWCELAFTWILSLVIHGRDLDGERVFFRFLSMLLAGTYCLGVAYRSSVSIVRERQQQTLDALFTLPVDAAEILKAKWWTSALRTWVWIIPLAATLIYAAVGAVVHPLALLLLTIAMLVHVAFLTSLGLFLSIVSRTVLVAQIRMAVAVLFLLVLGLVTYGIYGSDPTHYSFFVLNLSPPMCWFHLGSVGWHLDRLPAGSVEFGLIAIVASLLVYGVLAWFFWFLSCQWFVADRFHGQ